MKIPSGNSVPGKKRLSDKDLRRLRNAMARRKLQYLHEDKLLQSWVAEVWDQPVHAGATRLYELADKGMVAELGQRIL